MTFWLTADFPLHPGRVIAGIQGIHMGLVLMAHCGNHYSHNYALSVILEHKNSFLITRSQELMKEKPEMRI